MLRSALWADTMTLCLGAVDPGTEVVPSQAQGAVSNATKGAERRAPVLGEPYSAGTPGGATAAAAPRAPGHSARRGEATDALSSAEDRATSVVKGGEQGQ